MIFNEHELASINKIADKEPLIKKLLDEYLDYQKDSSKLYFVALNDAIIDIAKKIKSKTIDVEDTYTKSILKLAETGDKVFNTLERGKQELNKVMEDIDEQKQKKLGKSKDIAI